MLRLLYNGGCNDDCALASTDRKPICLDFFTMEVEMMTALASTDRKPKCLDFFTMEVVMMTHST